MNISEINNPYVPYSSFRYKVNQFGELIKCIDDSKVEVIEKDNRLYVELDWIDGLKLYEAALPVITAFRRYMTLPPHHYKSIISLYKNGDHRDLTPTNLTYKFPMEGIEVDHRFHKGFYYIPEYSGYGISKDCKVLNIRRDSIFTPLDITAESKMRNTVSIVSDFGKNHHPPVYRLLALTFVDHDESWENKDVNHINGNKHDDRAENLEWITHQENMIHAIETGLRSDNKRVECKNYWTNRVIEFRSMQTCVDHFDIGKIYLKKSLELGFMKLAPDPRYWFYIHYKGKKWNKKIDTDSIPVRKNTEDRSVKALNVFTGNVIIFANILKAARQLNIDRKTIRSHIERDSLIPSKEYVFRFMDDPRPFPKYTSDQLYVLKCNLSRYQEKRDREKLDYRPAQGYLVADLTNGEIKRYTGVLDLVRLLKKTKEYIYFVLKKHNDTYTFGNKYKVSIIRLEGDVI